MFKRFKVLFAETRQCGTVDFGVAANEVMDAGTKWLSGIIMPEFSRFVPLAIKDGFWAPVLRLFREKITTLQQEDFSAGMTKGVCQSATAHPGADNDEIEIVHSREGCRL
jgi:hypothetical protein